MESGIKNLSNYLLYNFIDTPDELYKRLKLNVALCETLNTTIYSFPMKYHPINDPKYFSNRNYIGKHWNRKYIRAIQAILNSTKGKIGKGKSFFYAAFGRNLEEYHKILLMPEPFIMYRMHYDDKLRAYLQETKAIPYKDATNDTGDFTEKWYKAYCALSESERKEAESIIKENKFSPASYQSSNKKILSLLEYYKIKR